MSQANGKSKSEKFPPPHQDAAVGYPQDTSHNGPGPLSFGADPSFSSSIFDPRSSRSVKETAVIGGGPSTRRKGKKQQHQMAPSRKFIRAFFPSSINLSMDLRFKGKGSVSEVFASRR